MNRMLRLPVVLASTAAVCALMILEPVLASGDAARGKEKSATCQGCHGQNGVSPAPQFPTIAGQYQSYLEHALQQYKSGERKNAIMAGIAAPLTNQDIADLSAWYASQPGVRKTPIN